MIIQQCSFWNGLWGAWMYDDFVEVEKRPAILFQICTGISL